MTPEEIEALAKEEIQELKKLAMSLHEATVGTLETPLPSAEVESQVRLRTALKLKLDEAIGYVSDQISDLEAVKRDLRNVKGWQTSDEDRLTSYMFSRIREEKKGNS